MSVRRWKELYRKILRYNEPKRTPARVEAVFDEDTEFVPFVVPLRRDRIYKTVLEQVEVLDDQQVEKVVQFYALQQKVCDLGERMNSKDYAGLKTDRRKAILLSLNSLEDRLITFGDAALAVLGDAAAQARQAQFNRTGRGRSVPVGEG